MIVLYDIVLSRAVARPPNLVGRVCVQHGGASDARVPTEKIVYGFPAAAVKSFVSLCYVVCKVVDRRHNCAYFVFFLN